jgi:hypothetical protein
VVWVALDVGDVPLFIGSDEQAATAGAIGTDGSDLAYLLMQRKVSNAFRACP